MNSDRGSFLFKLWAINNTICFPILPVTSMVTCWQRFEWPSACPRSSSTQTASCRTCWGQGSPQPCTGNPSRCRSLGRSTASSYWVVQVCAHQLTACVQREWCKVFRGVCHSVVQWFEYSSRNLLSILSPRSQREVFLCNWRWYDR